MRPLDATLLRIKKLPSCLNIPLRMKSIISELPESISMLFFQLQDRIMLRNNLTKLLRTLLPKQSTDLERKKPFTCHAKKSKPS
ncbi:hypothetical protein C6P77_00560 [Burkholderia ambifaria]|nr:hypothetical protein C6P77_00560 [Burkholderia ambifaria]